jgi:hypothetical protein
LESVDADRHISVRVSAKNLSGVAVYYARSLSLVSKKAIQLLSKPKFSGQRQVGRVLKVTKGTWRAEDRVSVNIRWMRCDVPVLATELKQLDSCVSIKNATGTSYKLRQLDKGKYVAPRVRAKSGKELSFFTPRSLRAIR